MGIMTQKRSNPIVFMDVRIGDFIAGRVTFELFADTHPFTAENFRCLCTGEKGLGLEGKQLHFKGSRFFRILEGFIIQGISFATCIIHTSIFVLLPYTVLAYMLYFRAPRQRWRYH